MLRNWVELNVVDNLAVMSVPVGVFEGLATASQRFQIPRKDRLAKLQYTDVISTISLPETDCCVLTTRSKATLFVRTPVEAKTLLLVADELEFGANNTRWSTAVPASIEDQDPAVDTEGGDEIGVLGLVASLVNLARVVNLLDDVEANSCNLSRRCLAAIAANLATLLIVIMRVWLYSLGYLNLGNLYVVGDIRSCVGAQEQTVNSVVLILGLFDIGEPLSRQCRPLQRGATDLN